MKFKSLLLVVGFIPVLVMAQGKNLSYEGRDVASLAPPTVTPVNNRPIPRAILTAPAAAPAPAKSGAALAEPAAASKGGKLFPLGSPRDDSSFVSER